MWSVSHYSHRKVCRLDYVIEVREDVLKEEDEPMLSIGWADERSPTKVGAGCWASCVSPTYELFLFRDEFSRKRINVP